MASVCDLNSLQAEQPVLLQQSEPEAIQESSEDVPEGALLGDMGDAPVEEREALVGKRLGIWWRQDRRFYYGTITAYDASSGAIFRMKLAIAELLADVAFQPSQLWYQDLCMHVRMASSLCTFRAVGCMLEYAMADSMAVALACA